MRKQAGSLKKGTVAAAGLTLALAFGAVPAFAADHSVEGESPVSSDMALVGTVKAPKDVVSVTMPSSLTWAFQLDAGGMGGTVELPQGVKYEIKNLDGTKTVGAKITKVVDPSDLLAKMSITLNGTTLVTGAMDASLGVAQPNGTLGLTLGAFVDNGPITPGDYTVTPTITLTSGATA